MSKKKNNSNQVILEKQETLIDSASTSSTKKQDQIEKKEPKISTNATNSKENEKSSTENKKAEQKQEKCKEEDKLVSPIGNEVEEIQTNTTKQVETEATYAKGKSYKTVIAFSVASIVILLLFCLFSTVFALVTNRSSTIINGVYIKNINVSGLTKEEALQKVSSALNDKLTQPITLKHNEYEVTVFPEQFDVSFSLEECVNMAYNIGRTRKCFPK